MSTNASLLTLGALVLHDGSGGSGGSYELSILSDSAAFGEPQPVEATLDSLLRDGALTRWDHDENRELSFLVRITASDLSALASGLEDLRLETNRPNTLTWTPPDGYGAPTAYEVQTSSLHEYNGYDDLAALRNQAVFRLRLICLPYGRSVNKITDDAQPASWSAGTVYDDGTSATNWSGWLAYRTPAVVVDAGAVRIDYGNKGVVSALSDGEPIVQWKNLDTRSGLSISTGSGGYLSLLVRLEKAPFTNDVQLSTGGVARTRVQSITLATPTGTLTPVVSAVEQLSDGSVRYAMAVDAGLTITAVTVESLQYAYAVDSPSDPRVWYDSLTFSSATTTANQYAKVVDVAGSVRAPGAIRVSAPIALGWVLLCSVADDAIATGFTADVTKWKTSGPSRTADAPVINGGYFAASGTAYVFEIPVAMLTEGAYTVVMLNRTGSGMTTTVTAQLVIGGVTVGDAQTITNSEPATYSGAYRMFSVGELYLPPVPIQGADSTAKVRLTIPGSTSAAFAEMWLIPTWGDLTLADCGTGAVSASGASSYFWADSPTPDRPMGSWWRGASSDRSLARSAAADLLQPGRHILYPPRTRILVAASAASGPTVTVDYFPRHWGAATQ